MSSGDSTSKADIEGLSNSTNDTGKNVRGKGTCTWMEDNKNEILEFNNMGVSVGSNDSRFARYLGGLARDHNLLPLISTRWPKVSKTIKDGLWEQIHATIECSPEDLPRMPLIKHNIMERVATYWRSYKNRLKKAHYDTKRDTKTLGV